MVDCPDCYEIEVGCPTLTLVLASEERMFPYSGFAWGRFEEAAIELGFEEWTIHILGRDLAGLWRALQLHDVRWIRARQEHDAEISSGDCLVTEVRLVAVDG